MAYICTATGCGKSFKEHRHLKIHRKSCKAALALIGTSVSKLKSAATSTAKIQRRENQELLLDVRENIREEINTVCLIITII